MKKKVLHLALLTFLEVIWLFPFHMVQPLDWGAAAALTAVAVCLCLLPQGWGSVAVAVLSVPLFFLFGAEYCVAYAPCVLACAAFRAALAGKQKLPLRRDVPAVVSLVSAGVAFLISLYYVFFTHRDMAFATSGLERHCLYAILSAVFVAVLTAVSFRLKKEEPRPGKAWDHTAGKLTAALAVMFAVIASAVLMHLRLGRMDGARLLGVFLCVYTAVTVPNPATDRLLGRTASR